jgi:hypothetical protein
MIFDNSVTGTLKIDAFAPLISDGLTIASGGSTIVDSIGGGWILGLKTINNPDVFDRN